MTTPTFPGISSPTSAGAARRPPSPPRRPPPRPCAPTPRPSPRAARSPVDPKQVTTAGFDLAEQLLRAQRDYVTTAVTLLTEAGEAVTAQASAAGETFKSRTEQATERVVDLATETTRRAAATARNGVAV